MTLTSALLVGKESLSFVLNLAPTSAICWLTVLVLEKTRQSQHLFVFAIFSVSGCCGFLLSVFLDCSVIPCLWLYILRYRSNWYVFSRIQHVPKVLLRAHHFTHSMGAAPYPPRCIVLYLPKPIFCSILLLCTLVSGTAEQKQILMWPNFRVNQSMMRIQHP